MDEAARFPRDFFLHSWNVDEVYRWAVHNEISAAASWKEDEVDGRCLAAMTPSTLARYLRKFKTYPSSSLTLAARLNMTVAVLKRHGHSHIRAPRGRALAHFTLTWTISH